MRTAERHRRIGSMITQRTAKAQVKPHGQRHLCIAIAAKLPLNQLQQMLGEDQVYWTGWTTHGFLYGFEWEISGNNNACRKVGYYEFGAPEAERLEAANPKSDSQTEKLLATPGAASKDTQRPHTIPSYVIFVGEGGDWYGLCEPKPDGHGFEWFWSCGARERLNGHNWNQPGHHKTFYGSKERHYG